MVNFTPPSPSSLPRQSSHHGRTLIDEYAWLRAPNWQEVLTRPSALPEAIRRHLQSEYDYFCAVMADTACLQAELAIEMRDRLATDADEPASIVWSRDGSFEYGSQFVSGATHPRLLRCGVGDLAPEVMVDLEVEAKKVRCFRAGHSMHSPNHRWLAWSRDESGSGRCSIRFRDLQTGEDQVGEVHDAYPLGAFSLNGSCFLYIRLDEHHRKSRLQVHRVGDESCADVLLLQETDPRFALGIRSTQSGDWLVASAHGHDCSDVYLYAADDPFKPARQVVSRREHGLWHIDEGCGALYALTNADGAYDYKIMKASLEFEAKPEWQELVPHKPGTTLVGHKVFRRHLVWIERCNGVAKAMVMKLADGTTSPVELGEAVGALDLGISHEFDTHQVRLVYSSMNTPTTIVDCDMDSHAITLINVRRVSADFQADDYITRQILARSSDGTQVPISLLYHRQTPMDGTAPCMLNGYGAYGVSLPAQFDPARLSLVDRGWVHAIAHVRGGGEFGQAWHEAGRAARKPNGIDDFIGAAEHLVATGHCAAGRIVSHGISAGGALVAGALNKAPRLFSGVIAQAPFVDVLNTMLDGSLPLTAQEWQEWGNPIASLAEFSQLAAWSPYENVTKQAYPPVLAVIGLVDPKVTYWEAAKWVARLRTRQTGQAPILLKVDFNAGHTGSTGRMGQIADSALLQAFALKVTERASAAPIVNPSQPRGA